MVLGKNFILIASIFKHPHGCLQAAVHGILSIGASPDYTYHYSHIFSTVNRIVLKIVNIFHIFIR